MTVKDLYDKIRYLAESPLYQNDEIVIPVEVDYVLLGHHPCVGISEVRVGFDWDVNRVFLDPSSKVRPS